MGREPGRAIRPAKPLRAAAVLLVLLFAVGDTAQPQGPAKPGRPAETGRGPAANDRVAAVLTPRREAVLSAEVPGRVVAVNKELGQRFQRDAVLVQLDDLTYRVNRETAEARFRAAERDLEQVRKLAVDRTRLRHAQAVLEAAQANLVATQNLHNDGHASQIDLENARRDATTAKTECELVAVVSAKELIKAERELIITRGQREIAADQLDACTIRAPYPGRVARVLVNEHEFVQRGTPLVEVVDDRVLLAKFLLPSGLFRSVRIGQELNLTVSETSQTVVVKVSHIAAVLDAASVTFEVYAEVDNADGNLRAGMNGLLSLLEIRGR